MFVYKFIFLGILFYQTASAYYVECTTDSDCIAPESKCDKGLCQCPPGKLLSKLGTQCLVVTKTFGGDCEDPIQCVIFSGEYACKEKKCKCADNWIYRQGRCWPLKKLGDSCDENVECFDGYDYVATVCQNNICSCRDGYYLRNGEHCRKESKETEPCAFDIDCKFENGICNGGICEKKGTNVIGNLTKVEYKESFTKIGKVSKPINVDDDRCPIANSVFSVLLNDCVCERGYFLKSKKICVKELGSPCIEDLECKDAGGICEKNLCTCETSPKPGKIVDELNNICRQLAVAPTFVCRNEKSCKLFLNNYECIDKKCSCLPSYDLNPNWVCEGSCVCTMPNTKCSSFGSCICNPGFSDKNGKCLADLGTSCKDEVNCEVPNSECHSPSEICQCKEGFVDAGDNTCVEVSDIGQKCETNIQCTEKISNSLCDEGKGECVCENSYMEIDGFCIKHPTRLGDFCSNKKMCETFGEGSICRNNECVCDKDSMSSPSNQKCVLKSNSDVLKINLSLLWISLVIFYNFP